MNETARHRPTAEAPLVSVIIPTFNRAHLLPQALESAFAQNYRPIEVIVVDDGSTDGTLDLLLRAWPQVVCIPQPQRGVSAARNTGVAHSSGGFLAFLDSDNLWPASGLRAAIALFEAQPKIGYVIGRRIFFLEPGHTAPGWVKPEWIGVPTDGESAGVLVVRREAWVRVGGFNTELAAGEDTEWLMRAREIGIPMAKLPEVLVYTRLHGDNLSTETFGGRKHRLLRMLRDSIHRGRNRKDP